MTETSRFLTVGRPGQIKDPWPVRDERIPLWACRCVLVCAGDPRPGVPALAMSDAGLGASLTLGYCPGDTGLRRCPPVCPSGQL